LARIAQSARANSQYPHVLVIDEINRANVAKVFGELYFLLEYRNESLQLQYRASEAFRLPENLFIIGTMNTADRSIALLDSAMRRRFSFVELHPEEHPVSGVLDSWLAKRNQSSERAELLSTLNSAIEDQDRDFKIGPSYLMRDGAETDQGLERIWRYDIMPLIEEHYYGRLTRDQIHSRFGLDSIKAALVAVTLQTRGAESIDTQTEKEPGSSP
jgi:5-methylcytosine-specific restriction protein B